MDPRKSARESFARANGLVPKRLVAMPADASFRRYFRYEDVDRPLLMMDAPPPEEDVRPFVKVAKHLATLGLRPPAIYAVDEAQGFVLLEDFGEATFTRLLSGGTDEKTLYEFAVDTLAHLHRIPEALRIDVPPYDIQVLQREAALFTEWYLPYVTGRSLNESARTAWDAAWASVIGGLPQPRKSLVLRDFHVDNLMLLEHGEGLERCGLLDFQDALIGPTAYDVVSLLEDARRDVPENLQRSLKLRYIELSDDIDQTGFDAWFNVLGAQRHAKVLGIFVRLNERDGKSSYLKHLARVRRLLDAKLATVELTAVRQWFEKYLGDAVVPTKP